MHKCKLKVKNYERQQHHYFFECSVCSKMYRINRLIFNLATTSGNHASLLQKRFVSFCIVIIEGG